MQGDLRMKEHERVFTSLNLGSEWIIKGLDETVKNCFELKYRGELKCPSCGAEAKKYGFEPSRRYWKHIGGLSGDRPDRRSSRRSPRPRAGGGEEVIRSPILKGKRSFSEEKLAKDVMKG